MKFTPPHSIEAEQALISCMLLEQRVAVQAVEELRTEDFYRETHKLIYGAIQEIVDKHQELNLVSLIDLLKLKGQLADAGDVAYITHLSMARPTTAGWKEFLRIVHEYATKRLLAKLGQTMAIRSQGEEAAEAQVDEALEDLTEIATGTRERGFEDAETLVARTLDHITNRSEEEYYLGVPTCFSGLDDLTSGLQAGDLFILAARPSMGKTAFALNMVRGIISHAHTVGFFSLEMSSEQLISRLLAAMAEVDGQDLNRGKLDGNQWDYVYDAAAELSKTKLFIDDSSTIGIRTIRSRARRLQAEQGLDAIFIDYLQLLPSPDSRNANRQEEISMLSRKLKSLAKELKVPIVALSQLSRAVEGRQNKRPMLSDLRESGSLEQDADIVAFLYREDYYNPETENKHTELIIAKHRNGPVDTVNLFFKKEFTKFVGFTKMQE